MRHDEVRYVMNEAFISVDRTRISVHADVELELCHTRCVLCEQMLGNTRGERTRNWEQDTVMTNGTVRHSLLNKASFEKAMIVWNSSMRDWDVPRCSFSLKVMVMSAQSVQKQHAD